MALQPSQNRRRDREALHDLAAPQPESLVIFGNAM
jgi:hypothetical protein